MSNPEVPAASTPAVPNDIASRILEGFKRGELPAWMARTSYNSAVLKVGLGDGETVSITAPSQRLAEAKESTNDAVLQLLIQRADGEDVGDATLEEARARASRAGVDYLAGVITEFGPAIKFERPLVVGDEVLFQRGDPIPPLSDVKDPAAREAIVKDHLAPGLYVQVSSARRASRFRRWLSQWLSRKAQSGLGLLFGADRSDNAREDWQELAGEHPHVAESLREALRYRVAGTLPVPGAAWLDQPVPFISLVSQLMDAGIIDVGFAREETLREVPKTLLEGIARMVGGKG